MNCKLISPLIIEHVDGTLDEFQKRAVSTHIKSCKLCKNQVDNERLLQNSLKKLSEIEAPADFCKNVFAEIEEKRSRKTHFFTGISSAIAASMVFWLVFAPLQQVQQAQPQNAPRQHAIEIAVNDIENIRLSFEAPDNFKQVTLTVNLPEQIELKGFPGKRQISWETSLNSGSNILTLPVLGKTVGEGVVEAKISNSQKSKTFKIHMTATPGKQASLAIQV